MQKMLKVLVKTKFWTLQWLRQHCFTVQCRHIRSSWKEMLLQKKSFYFSHWTYLHPPGLIRICLETGAECRKHLWRSRLEEERAGKCSHPKTQVTTPEREARTTGQLDCTESHPQCSRNGLAMSKYIVVGLTALSGDNTGDFSMHT